MSPNAESYTDSKIVGKVAKKWIQKQGIDRKVKDMFSFKHFLRVGKGFRTESFCTNFFVTFHGVELA